MADFDPLVSSTADNNTCVLLNMAAMQTGGCGWLSNLFVKFDPGKGKKEAPAVEDLVKKSGLPTATTDPRTHGILMGPPGAGKGTQVRQTGYLLEQ